MGYVLLAMIVVAMGVGQDGDSISPCRCHDG